LKKDGKKKIFNIQYNLPNVIVADIVRFYRNQKHNKFYDYIYNYSIRDYCFCTHLQEQEA